MKHFKTHKDVEWDIVPCPWWCPEEKFCNEEECPNSAGFIPDLAGSCVKVYCQEWARSFTYVFIAYLMVTKTNIGPGAAWGWTLVQKCTYSVRLFSLASKGGLIWIMCLVEERKEERGAGPQTDYVRGLHRAQHIPPLLKPLFESNSLEQDFEKKVWSVEPKHKCWQNAHCSTSDLSNNPKEVQTWKSIII